MDNRITQIARSLKHDFKQRVLVVATLDDFCDPCPEKEELQCRDDSSLPQADYKAAAQAHLYIDRAYRWEYIQHQISIFKNQKGFIPWVSMVARHIGADLRYRTGNYCRKS